MISQKEFIAQAFPKMKIRHKILRRLFEYASRIKLAEFNLQMQQNSD